MLRAKVNYRKFAWWNTQWAFAGVRDASPPGPPITPAHDDGVWRFTGDTSGVSGAIKAIPDIPTTVMAAATASIAVVDERATPPAMKPFMDASVRSRWNDYGIGLLLQGDLKGAQAAFRNVMAMDPGYADGPVNVARAQLQEGDIAGAVEMLDSRVEDCAASRQDAFLPRHGAQDARPLRRSTICASPPNSTRATASC